MKYKYFLTSYKWLTLIRQAFATIYIGIKAILICPCDILIDTLGTSWFYPFIKLLWNCQIISYTHYPIISSDMIKKI